jgi:glycosyltransferase involved in cell wall biosynthesis
MRCCGSAYNAERWISSAIQSLRSQSHGGWKCIVIDDASSDATQAEAERAAGGDDRFTISRNSARKGAARNFYEALEEGEGRRLGIQDEDVVVVLDGDDWLAGGQPFAINHSCGIMPVCLSSPPSH